MSNNHIIPGKYPHTEFLDIDGTGNRRECAVMKRDIYGNVYFFQIAPLDRIDKERVLRLVRNPNAKLLELWDLMSQTTLGNGVNALEYFNQLTRVLTVSGQVLTIDQAAGLTRQLHYNSMFAGNESAAEVPGELSVPTMNAAVQDSTQAAATQLRRGGRAQR